MYVECPAKLRACRESFRALVSIPHVKDALEVIAWDAPLSVAVLRFHINGFWLDANDTE